MTIEELIEELQKLQKNAGGWNMPVMAQAHEDGHKSPKRKIQELKIRNEQLIIQIGPTL